MCGRFLFYVGGVVSFAWRGIRVSKCAVWLLILASAFHASTSRNRSPCQVSKGKMRGPVGGNVSQLSGVNVYDELLLGVSSCVVYVANYLLLSAYCCSRCVDLQQWPLHVAQCVCCLLYVVPEVRAKKGAAQNISFRLKW